MGHCIKLKKLTLPPCCTTPTQALIAQGEAKVILYFQMLVKSLSTKVLELSAFRLPSVSKEIEALTILTNLQFSTNLMVTLPWGIGQLSNVTELNLSKNKIQELPESMVNMSMMRLIDISFNPRILAVPAAFGSMSLLESLNTLGCKSLLLPSLDIVDESWTRTKQMLKDVFKGCRDESFSAINGYNLNSSEWLSILWKSFDALNPERCCNGLKNLSLSYNRIATLHRDLFQISSLVTLLVFWTT
jgi:Leucine-rich repeat (LRR) protein